MKLFVTVTSVLALATLFACSSTTKHIVEDDTNPTDPASSSSSGKTASSSSSSSGGSSTSSTSSSSGSSGKSSSSSSSSSGSTSSGSTSSGSTSSSGGQTGDAACAAKADADTCASCCETNHSTGADTYYGAIDTCVCQTSVCGSQCAATYCAASPQNPDTACNNCIQSKIQASCQAPVTTACQGDPDCVALNTCYNSCPQ